MATHHRRRLWLLQATRADIPFLVILFQTTVSLLISPLPGLSARAAWPHLLGLGLFWVLSRRAMGARGPWRAAWVMTVAGSGIALLGFAGMLAKPGVLIPALQRLAIAMQSLLGRRVQGLLSESFHPNVVAGALLLTVPFVAWLIRSHLRAPRRLVPALAATAAGGLILSVLILTQSRAAFIGLATAVTIAMAVARPRWLLVAAPLGVAGIVAGAGLLGWGRLGDALISSDPVFGLSWRKEVWASSWLMATDFLYTGVGFGCFEPVLNLLYPLPSGTSSPHAHNLLLQVAIDIGSPGALAYLVLVGNAGARAWQGARAGLPDLGDAGARLALACLAALAGMLAHGVLDAAVWGNKGAALPWALLGLAYAASHRPIGHRAQ